MRYSKKCLDLLRNIYSSTRGEGHWENLDYIEKKSFEYLK